MSTTKHTPAPWTVTHDGNVELCVMSGDKSVIDGCGCCGSPWGENLAGDAPLISAAPDLLAALIEYVNSDQEDEPLNPIKRLARDAIVKATGGAA